MISNPPESPVGKPWDTFWTKRIVVVITESSCARITSAKAFTDENYTGVDLCLVCKHTVHTLT